jgi:hypothetical protein
MRAHRGSRGPQWAGLAAAAVAFGLVAYACTHSQGPNGPTPPPGGGSGNISVGPVPAGFKFVESPKDAPPAVNDQRLRTSGTKIVTASGKAVRLIGVNLLGLQSSNDDGSTQPDQCNRSWRMPPDLETSATNIEKWGFNVVRLPVAWANIEPQAPSDSGQHQWSQEYLDAIHKVVTTLEAHHIAVILDMTQHGWSSAFKQSAGVQGAAGEGGTAPCEGYGMPAWLSPNAGSESIQEARCAFFTNQPESGVPINPWDGFAAAWQELLKDYANDPGVVGVDVINEPYFDPTVCSTADFPGFYKLIGQKIRDVAPKTLLIYQFVTFMDALQRFHLTSPPPFDNEVYSVHLYTKGWGSGQQRGGLGGLTGQEVMDQAAQQAEAWNLPLYLGEFNAFGYGRGLAVGDQWVSDTAALLDFLKEHHAGWTFFAYGGQDTLITPEGRQPREDLIAVLQSGLSPS